MIYIHVPFCRSWCSYCDFYSEIACRGKDSRMIDTYLDELLSEISLKSSEIRSSLQTNTLYIGGGTPSVLPLRVLERILAALKAVGAPAEGQKGSAERFEEFSLEVNPDDICANALPYALGLRSLGVNRISMGVQSWDDGILRWMNRRHDSSCALRAFGLLREAGFNNISIDLIFGLSNLSMDTLNESLEKTCSLRPEHISAYQLSIESGSALGSMLARGEYIEADEDLCSRQYDLICRRLAQAGYVHYEISSWALSGFEARHNSAYWSRQAYVGLGPGAHSFDGLRKRSWNASRLHGWSSSVDPEAAVHPEGSDSEAGFELLNTEEIAEEKIMLSLRTAKGVLESDCPQSAVEALLQRGDLVRILSEENTRLRIPEEKFFVSDEIIAQLL